MEIEIELVGKGKAIAELDQRNPITATKIYKLLPIDGEANLYLEEVYFVIPIKLEYENTSTTSKKGDISYWPPGSAFCIFYGDSQPASDVNHVGKVTKNLGLWHKAESGDEVIIKKL